MVYRNRFVACIKVNGKVLRESSDAVTIPFGSEYSILLKNLNSVRALVKVSVDGKDATEGTWLIVKANGHIELERYIRNGNLNRGNRFKFIERTGDIEEHRGIGIEDGLIRIEYKLEQTVVERPVIRKKYYDEYVPVPRPYYPPYDPWWPHNPWRSPYRWEVVCQASQMGQAQTQTTGTMQGGQNVQSHANFCSTNSDSASLGEVQASMSADFNNDAGITVPGSESQQQFHQGAYFPTESNSEVIVIRLRGAIGNKRVVAPITVERKPQCESCGKINKADSAFCSKCGTALSMI